MVKPRRVKLSLKKIWAKVWQWRGRFLVVVGVGLLVWGLFCLTSFFSKRNLSNRSLVIGFDGQPASLVAINWPEREATIIKLPANLLVPAPRGRGDYPLRGLGLLPGGEEELVREGLALLFQTPVEVWVEDFEGEVDRFSLARFARRCGLGQVTPSQLTPGDCWQLRRTFLGVGRRNWEVVDLSADHTAVRVWGLEEVLEFTPPESVDWWRDEDFVQLDFGVANATKANGLATLAAGFLENLGGAVIKIGEWGEPVERCQLRVKPDLKSSQKKAVARLESFWGCEVIEGGFGDYLVDVLLVVGREFECRAQGCPSVE